VRLHRHRDHVALQFSTFAPVGVTLQERDRQRHGLRCSIQNGYAARGRRASLLLCACAVVMSLAIVGSARASTGLTLVVTTTSDTDPATSTGNCATGGSCTIRDAVNQANVDTNDIIELPPGTYVLNTAPGYGPLTFTSSATVVGTSVSSTLIDGYNSTSTLSTQIMVVQSGTVGLQDVTLENGNSGSGDGGGVLIDPGATLAVSGAAFSHDASDTGDGGAIADQGTLTVNDSSFTGNSALNGGAILVSSASGGSAAVTDSTLSGNTASATGGAINVEGYPSLTVSASAVVNNTAGLAGGGIADSTTASPIAAPFSIIDSTIAGNSATTAFSGTTSNVGGGGLDIGNNVAADQIINDTIADNSSTGSGGGGDVRVGSGTLPDFENTIVAAGSASIAGTEPDCSGQVLSQGHNLTDATSGANECGFNGGAGDITGANPVLGPLQNNGGLTETIALLAGSPAIDAGSNAVCPATDQREVARPQGAACDIGAYESAPLVLGTTSVTMVGSTTATVGTTVANPDVQGGTVVFRYGTTTSYGSTTPAQAVPASTSATPFAAGLTGLTPDTVYHYRAVATDPDGIVSGPDEQFTTAAATTTSSVTKPPVNTFTFGRVKVSSKGKLTVPLGAPDAGRFSAKATFSVRKTVITHKGKKRVVKHVKTTYTYGTGSAKSSKKSTVDLGIALKGSAARELKKLGSAKVTITVTFTPTGGKSHKESTTVKVKRSRKGKYS